MKMLAQDRALSNTGDSNNHHTPFSPTRNHGANQHYYDSSYTSFSRSWVLTAIRQ